MYTKCKYVHACTTVFCYLYNFHFFFRTLYVTIYHFTVVLSKFKTRVPASPAGGQSIQMPKRHVVGDDPRPLTTPTLPRLVPRNVRKRNNSKR